MADSPLHKAAQYDHAEELRGLLKEGKFGINLVGVLGRTPLHRAVAYNSKSCVQILTEMGADVNIQDSEGRTPLHYAAAQGYIQCLELLLSTKSIQIDARDKYGYTPLLVATKQQKADCMTLLIQRGADFNVTDRDGKGLNEICKDQNFKTPRILNEIIQRRKRESRYVGAAPVTVDTFKGEEILKSGMLWKRGGKRNDSWKLRFCVLTKKPEILYFSEKVDASNWKEKRPKGNIPILKHNFMEYSDKDRSDTFKIVPNDTSSRIWFIGANSHQEKDEWMRVLKQSQNTDWNTKVAIEIDKELRSFSIEPEDLQIFDDQVLGKGGNGVVKKGLWLGSTEVAVKTLKGRQNDIDEEEAKLFYQEIKTISELRHINIVSMFGYCFKDDCLCLVTEYIPKGDLSKYMFDKAYVMDPLLKLSILLTICRGMSYLHNKNVIHCDLKPGNVLVENLEEAKLRLCDFGLSVAINKVKLESMHSSPTYEAPELSSSNYNRKVDVYSFGILMWELDEREHAWSDAQFSIEIFKRVKEGQRPPVNPNSLFKDMIPSCWDQSPAKRPEFRAIFDTLTNLYNEVKEKAPALFVPKLDSSKTAEENILQVFGNENEASWPDFENTLAKVFNSRPERVNTLKHILATQNPTTGKFQVSKEQWKNFLQWFNPLRVDDGYDANSKNKGESGVGYSFEEIYEICSQPWFFGFIPVEICTDILNKRPFGTYMLRFSRNPGYYTLSVSTSTKVAHWRISCEKGGGTTLTFKCGTNSFKNLSELFEHFSIHPLRSTDDTAPTLLGSPCKKDDFSRI